MYASHDGPRINALDGVKPYIVRLCKYGIRSWRDLATM